MENNQKPLVSIVLPMYNAQDTINECIDSILSQTYKNIEINVIDDGSTDESYKLVKTYSDKRIHLYKYKHNYIKNLNRAFTHCHGKYIARMDADDKMLPSRIERQVEILENNNNVAVCWSGMKIMGRDIQEEKGFEGVIPNLCVLLLRGNLVLHPTVMIRKSILTQNIKYRSSYIYAEDYKLWTEIALKGLEFYRIADALIEYRISTEQVSHVHQEEQNLKALLIRQELLEALIRMLPIPLRGKVKKLYNILLSINNDDILSPESFFDFFFDLFLGIKEKGTI